MSFISISIAGLNVDVIGRTGQATIVGMISGDLMSFDDSREAV